MKKFILACLTLVLSVPLLMFAQNSTQQQDDQAKKAQEEANQAAQVDEMGGTTLPKHTMSGAVSNNGKTLTSDNTSYVVGNPKKLKSYDGQSVSVVFQFDTDNNTIHIVSVSPSQSPAQPQQ